MKTVKTANGVKKIEDTDGSLVPLQLRSILQEHRTVLVNRLLNGGLEAYIDYKFATKAEAKQLEQIKNNLDTLKNSGINSDVYAPIFNKVQQHEFITLENVIFYNEIDRTIKETLFQPRLFRERNQLYFQ
ncbi:MAG TPA: hypothetical protein VGK59_13685 [Ohtaekwangia sp.]